MGIINKIIGVAGVVTAGAVLAGKKLIDESREITKRAIEAEKEEKMEIIKHQHEMEKLEFEASHKISADYDKANVKHCNSCGALNNIVARYCSGCGSKLQNTGCCIKCGKELNPNSSFCIYCGYKAR